MRQFDHVALASAVGERGNGFLQRRVLGAGHGRPAVDKQVRKIDFRLLVVVFDLSRGEEDEAVRPSEQHFAFRGLVASPHVVGPAAVRDVDLRFADHPVGMVVIVKPVVGAEPDIFRGGVFEDAEDCFALQPFAVPVPEIDVTAVAAQQVDPAAAGSEPDVGVGGDAVRAEVVDRIGGLCDVMALQNPPCGGIDDV